MKPESTPSHPGAWREYKPKPVEGAIVHPTARKNGKKIEEIAKKEGIHRGSVYSSEKKMRAKSMAEILYPSCHTGAHNAKE